MFKVGKFFGLSDGTCLLSLRALFNHLSWGSSSHRLLIDFDGPRLLFASNLGRDRYRCVFPAFRQNLQKSIVLGPSPELLKLVRSGDIVRKNLIHLT